MQRDGMASIFCNYIYWYSYTLKEDGHVRVDLIYDRLTKRKKQ